MPSVHKVPHENVARLRHFPPAGEELEEVVKLAVDVPADRDGAPYWLDVAFFDKNFFHLCFGFVR